MIAWKLGIDHELGQYGLEGHFSCVKSNVKFRVYHTREKARNQQQRVEYIFVRFGTRNIRPSTCSQTMPKVFDFDDRKMVL